MRDIISLVTCHLCGHILKGNGTYAYIFLTENGTYADCLHMCVYIQLYIYTHTKYISIHRIITSVVLNFNL